MTPLSCGASVDPTCWAPGLRIQGVPQLSRSSVRVVAPHVANCNGALEHALDAAVGPFDPSVLEALVPVCKLVPHVHRTLEYRHRFCFPADLHTMWNMLFNVTAALRSFLNSPNTMDSGGYFLFIFLSISVTTLPSLFAEASVVLPIVAMSSSRPAVRFPPSPSR